MSYTLLPGLIIAVEKEPTGFEIKRLYKPT